MSVGITILVLEFIFVESIINILPLKTHWHLDKSIRVFAQSSKKTTIPRDYILLVGDSYSEGQGDWFKKSREEIGRPDFHSAHLIHNKSGIDVISLGSSGSGSLDGYLRRSISRYEFANVTRFKIEQPKIIFAYFYEGNDIHNNVYDINIRFRNVLRDTDIFDSEQFSRFISEKIVDKNRIYKLPISPSWFDLKNKFFLTRLFIDLADSYIDNWIDGPRNKRDKNQYKSNDNNSVLISNTKYNIPRYLEGPALELSSEELELGVYVFKQSLHYLKSYFDKSEIVVVYIPSPLASYEVASDLVSITLIRGMPTDRERNFKKEKVTEKSNKIATLISEAVVSVGVDFIDTRKQFRNASKTQLIHGPNDWQHLNQPGYTVLADVMLDYLENQ